MLGAHLNIIVGGHLNWLAKIKLKGPGPPGSILLLGAQLNKYCRGPHLNWLVKITLRGPGPLGSILLLGAIQILF